jgi:hypothetical protein
MRRRKLSTNDLIKGIDAVNPVIGAFITQALSVCLDRHGHLNGVELNVKGEFTEIFEVYWDRPTDLEKLGWNIKVATEHGACAIAVLLIRKLTRFTVIETACNGTGIDYWLGYRSKFPFQRKARLEVSGVYSGPKRVKARASQKLDQTKRSDGLLPAYVVIVEFSKPESQVTKK